MARLDENAATFEQEPRIQICTRASDPLEFSVSPGLVVENGHVCFMGFSQNPLPRAPPSCPGPCHTRHAAARPSQVRAAACCTISDRVFTIRLPNGSCDCDAWACKESWLGPPGTWAQPLTLRLFGLSSLSGCLKSESPATGLTAVSARPLSLIGSKLCVCTMRP